MAHSYLMSELKQSIERVFLNNLSVDNYVDTYMVANGFDCAFLKDGLFEYGRAHLQALRVARVVS